LFNFYLEWNEKNQNRSMRHVLELLGSLIASNPDQSASRSVKYIMCQRLTLIVAHQASQPLVKPAFKSLEYFLGKRIISPNDLVSLHHIDSNTQNGPIYTLETGAKGVPLDDLISETFDWMNLPDVAPAAGKFLVTLFKELRNTTAGPEKGFGDYTTLWQRWIRKSLSRNPDSLENVKNYLFPPLFKLDRAGSIAFLEDLNKQTPMTDLQSQELDAHFLLHLAAVEVGKKAGLVEEPSMS
jgi:hypothetical protein